MSGGEGHWRRVHPLSPLLRMWAVLVSIVAVLTVQQVSMLRRLGDLLAELSLPPWLTVLVVIAAVILVFAVGWLISVPWWRATGYRVDAEEIAVRSGVVSRQLRTARFDRVQAVDLVEPLAPRIFRLAAVKVETAGGAGSSVRVEFLPRRDAERLRSRLLELVHGTPRLADGSDGAGERSGEGAGETAGELPGTPVVPTIPVSRSLVAAALSGSTALAVLGALLSTTTSAGLAALMPALVGAIPWFWGVLNTSWRFTSARSGDVLGITYGLTERRRQSVPLSRVHAVELSQPVIWRLLGWWRVRVDVAGYGVVPGDKVSTTTVLPVGSFPVALHVVEVLTPLTPPEIAAVVDPAGTPGPVEGARIFRSPAAARWVSPIDRSRQRTVLVGGHDGPGAVVAHHGRFRRRVAVVSPAHIQELTHRQGPVQRALGLAGVRFDLVPGPVTMAGRDLATEDAAELVSVLRSRHLPQSSGAHLSRG